MQDAGRTFTLRIGGGGEAPAEGRGRGRRPAWTLIALLATPMWLLRPWTRTEIMTFSKEDSPLIPRNPPHHTHNIQVKAGPLLGIPLLLVVTSHDLSLLRRSLESIRATTLNSGLHLIATVADPTQPILDLLNQHSFTVHSYSTGPKSWLSRMLPKLPLAENLQQVARKFKIKIPENVCRKDTLSGEVKLLQTHANGSNIIISRPTLNDMAKNERKIMYIDNPYNPMHRRAVLNGGGGGGGECKEVEQLKEAMDYVMQTYPELKYLLLLETGLSLSPDFVSFFAQTLPALQQDPSLYCLSAASPLSLLHHPGNASRLHRVDHFVGTATLLPRRLLEEIVQEFVVFEDEMMGGGGGGGGEGVKRTSIEWLTEWLSWWGRRYRRGCAVPDEPRVCSLHHTPPPHTHPCSDRPADTRAATVDISRLLHYKYSQNVYWDITAASPLGVSQISCLKPDFFPPVMNESIYIIYIKMENYDDDFTFHHVMKCFGVDLPKAVGYFEGVFQFTFRGKRMLLLGIPYSRFSPSIKDHNALIVADIPKLFVHGQTNYLRNRHAAFTFDNVLVIGNTV